MADDAMGQVRNVELDAEGRARRRLALAQIRQYPDPVLRLRAGDVESFDDDLVRLAERMKALMLDASGVGLAATQVGVLRRVFVFQTGDDGVRAVVNPQLDELADEREVDVEGCLSLAGVVVPVERRAGLTLLGQDERGSELRLELAGYAARVVQHEVDHLDGVLMLDRTDSDSRREALRILRPRPALTSLL